MLALTSKLNSDATGMRYQWGRKDPFTYATSSERWGSGEQTGKYPVKIYTIDGVLIYQAEDGSGNTDTGTAPKGGVILQTTPASSMLNTIANPITYYAGGSPYTVINQDGHSGDLYNYYWTSYSRGTDGSSTNTQWHNVYLDGYIPLRVKSIYDPCPYLYRIPSNGTYNQFGSNAGWTVWSYMGGVSWNLNTLGDSWLSGLGYRGSSVFGYTGLWGFYFSSTTSDHVNGYDFQFSYDQQIWFHYSRSRSYGTSVRCIEDCDRCTFTFSFIIEVSV